MLHLPRLSALRCLASSQDKSTPGLATFILPSQESPAPPPSDLSLLARIPAPVNASPLPRSLDHALTGKLGKNHVAKVLFPAFGQSQGSLTIFD
jgi:hypothetical protein